MSNPGYNALLTTDTAGAYRVRAIRLDLGFDVVSGSAEGKRRKVFYPGTTTTSAFTMQVAFPSWESREKFNKWLAGFMNKTIAGRGFKAAMRVEVPSRDFARNAVPLGPIQYGEGLTDVGYTCDLNFVGATNPLDINFDSKRSRSYFAPPAAGGATSKFFYPSGVQVSGAESLDGALFDDVATPSPTLDDPRTPEDMI